MFTAPGALTNADVAFDVVAFDRNDSVRAGLTALPNAAAGASGGLPTLDVNLNIFADVKRWLASTPDVLSSGKVPADVKLWLTAAPDALSSGKMPSDVKLWLTGTPDSLSTGKVPSDVKLWLTAAPDALSSGKVAADVKLWLATAPAVVSSSGLLKVMIERWLTDDGPCTPNVLISGKVDATGASAAAVASEVMAFVLRAGAGSDPDSTVIGHLRRMDALFFGKVIGLLGAVVQASQPGGVTTELSVSQNVAAGSREEADRTASETP